MATFDRTRIVGLLKSKFPELGGKTSSEVQAFLNEQTKANVTNEMPNGVAFDLWRQALARDGNPEFWPYNSEHLEKIKERTDKMLEEENERLLK